MLAIPAMNERTFKILKGLSIVLRYDPNGTIHTRGGLLLFMPEKEDRLEVSKEDEVLLEKLEWIRDVIHSEEAWGIWV